MASGDDLIQCPSSNHGKPELVALGCTQVDFDVSRDGDHLLLCSVILKFLRARESKARAQLSEFQAAIFIFFQIRQINCC